MFEQYITVLSGKTVTKIKVDDIIFIERHLRKLCIVTDKELHEYYERIENIEPYLDYRFYPCLQGCYINFEKVISMREQQIIFEDGRSFYLGRANFIKTRQAYKKYLKNKLENHKNACNCKGNSI